jgi:hypothetical protein
MQRQLSDRTAELTAELAAQLKAARAALHEAVAAGSSAAITKSLGDLNVLVERIAKYASTLKASMTAAEFDAGVLGASPVAPDPAIDEAANLLLILVSNGLASFCSATRFQRWCRTGDLSGSVGEIRERFFADHPSNYLTKTVCRHLLAAQGITRE